MFFRGTLVDCLVSKKQSNHNKIRRSSFIIFFKNNFKSNVNIQRFTKFKFQLGTILPPKRIFWGFDEREVHVSVFGVNFPAMENRPCSSSQNWPSTKSTFPSQVYRYQGQTIISRIFGCVCWLHSTFF